MKDPISKYIESEKEKLDTFTPGENNWESIEKRINKKRNKKRLYWMVSSAAAILLLFIFTPGNSDVTSESKSQKIAAQQIVTEQQVQTGEYSFNTIQPLPYNSNQRGYGKNKDLEVMMASYDTDAQTKMTLMEVDGLAGNVMYQNQHEEYDPYNRNYEQYDKFIENKFESPLDQPLSTFGIDVDGAGYSNVRRYINSGSLPPKSAVKLEEMVNYFNYDLREPSKDYPFSVDTELGNCPWESENLLLQIAIKGKDIDFEEQSNNLVFLIDVSGSMESSDKLPLLKESIKLAVDEMGSDDKIAIVVYAGAAGLVLPSTSCDNKTKILEAIEKLSAGGSTAGGEGIELAYKVAQEQFIKEGNNRIMLATDGDFNIGMSDDASLVKLIEKKRESGVFISVLGFGTGNLQSSKMEKIADNGNGNYYYIDNMMEAKKVLVDEIGGTMVTIAKDVKLQLEFNQDYVKSYRLLGYENRIMDAKDFDDDTKDSGDLGSGHTVVALYELIMQDDTKKEKVSNLRYQKSQLNNSKGVTDELVYLKFRYKKPDSNKSKLINKVVKYKVKEENSDNFLFASAVAEFGMLIRQSKYKADASFANVLARAKYSMGSDKHGYREEFISIVEASRELMIQRYMSW